MSALFKIRYAGPFVSVQDVGRVGYQRFGVTGSGPMDRLSFKLANYAIGNDLSKAAIEVSLGGLEIECLSGSVTAAIAGGSFNIKLNDQKLAACSIFTLETGAVLSVRPGEWGSWCYLAFSGDIQSEHWLASQAVHLNSGLCGRPFHGGDNIEIDSAKVSRQFEGEYLDAARLKPVAKIRVVTGPQDQYFKPRSLDDLFAHDFQLTPDYNRMGVRLSGPKLEIGSSLDMPSEPIARGSLQVPGHGDPIVLMADHQTTGGYPKIATVISCDQDRFAQLRVGDWLRFLRVDAQAANDEYRSAERAMKDLFLTVDANKIGFAERLAGSNLISGMIDMATDDNQF